MEIIKRDSDYALRALVYLAVKEGSVVSATEIASEQDIPLGFLQKLLQKCIRAGLVISHRGPQGGFTLARDPGEITVAEAVCAMQGPLVMNKCLLGKHGCSRGNTCPLKSRWLGIEAQIADFMNSVTLKELVSEVKGGRKDSQGSSEHS